MDSGIREGIDWKSIYRRLEASQTVLERRATRGAEEQRRILHERANLLAAESLTEPAAPTESLEVVEFLLAHERYGIESRCIREVYPLKDLRRLPSVPAFVLGLINLRGQILSVIDMKRFFDLPEIGLTDLNKALILDSGGMELGVLADVILSVRSIPMRDLQPALPTLTGIRADYVKGITREPVVVLDAEKLLSDTRILVDEG